MRGQTAVSLAEHIPEVCSKNFTDWGKKGACPVPQFAGNPPMVRKNPVQKNYSLLFLLNSV